MPTRTVDPLQLGRSSSAAWLALFLLAVVVGIWPITGFVTTMLPVLAVPAAAGLPFLIPPVRLVPLGETTWLFWAADTVAALAMLAAAWFRLRATHRKRPTPNPWRAFTAALGATILGVIVGNLVRGVFVSFVVNADLGTYLGYLIANIVVSALTGALCGIIVGVVAAAVAAVRRPSPPPLIAPLEIP